LPPKLKAAAGPNPDPDGYDEEPEAELIPIPALNEVKLPHSFGVCYFSSWFSKYRDPLHILLEYIADVSAVKITFLRALVLI
jgi:hypothetical protein